MKLSVFTEHLYEAARQSGKPLGEILRTVRALGIGGVELDHERLNDNPRLPRLLRESGLEIACVYAFFDFGHSDDTARIEAVLDALDKNAIRLLMAIPGFFAPGDDRRAVLNRMIEGMERLIESAKTRGIAVCLEDFDDENAPFSTADGLLYFLDKLPRLGCAFDTGNFRYSGEDELSAFGRLKPRIVHLHCKDRRRAPLRPGEEEKEAVTGEKMYPAAVGEGTVKIEPIVRALLADGYRGWLAIEHFGSADQLADIRRSAENLTRWEV
ncbi:MAG: sugar phosphate isomerase/epimerase [Bacteroides sp.]|nr:sugar phosphate isomerase/epimerase [Roseburia sp.]MCM1461602.1 sugar phosphate isomerase/epimerase [Bacteroides sp.]